MTLIALRRVVTNRMHRRRHSARSLCRELHMKQGHHAHLAAFLKGERPPTPALLRALGYKRVQAESYVRDK